MWIRGSIPYADLLDQAILTPQQLEHVAHEIGSLMDTKWNNLGFQVEFSSGDTANVRMPARMASATRDAAGLSGVQAAACSSRTWIGT